MKKEVIRVDTYCSIHNIDTAFIDVLEELGLVELVSIRRQRYIPHELLGTVERLINWHYELEVSPQGLDVVETLYQKVVALQLEIDRLRIELKNA